MKISRSPAPRTRRGMGMETNNAERLQGRSPVRSAERKHNTKGDKKATLLFFLSSKQSQVSHESSGTWVAGETGVEPSTAGGQEAGRQRVKAASNRAPCSLGEASSVILSFGCMTVKAHAGIDSINRRDRHGPYKIVHTSSSVTFVREAYMRKPEADEDVKEKSRHSEIIAI
ncbi:hypothetical protein BO71DRAFT_51511 [Aspergillus ellipticus CBS 707.79]|uniref:Uncharacterized protein n=1 Tax=Aspergillus ellipticus CBS 707.79 TaxID=1448320 RepID=A0A319D2R6_9EURO|nr:hypothetical protein BO71DRAFT_51511 [Aspergillus ellipticus CBS 707.79]